MTAFSKYILIASIAGLAGCASVTRGTHEVLVINSEPTASTVALSDGESCMTPCSLKLKRNKGLHVSVTHDGYQTTETEVNTEVATGGAAGMAGNALIGGVIGAVVDSSNGSMNKFVPNPLDVTLVKLDEGTQAVTPVVAKGESFDFKVYKKSGEKVPFSMKERVKQEQEAKAAKKKAEKEAKAAEKKARKEAKAAEKKARKEAKEAKKAEADASQED